MNNKIISAIVGLIVLATPAFACYGYDCLPTDGVIKTYFSGSGWDVSFNDAVIVVEIIDDDYVYESLYTQKGSITVEQNVNIGNNWMGSPEVIVNKEAWINPASSCWGTYTAYADKEALWDDNGGVYREVTMGSKVFSPLSASSEEGRFMENIAYEGNVYLFQSVGLNTGYKCTDPVGPSLPDTPVCTWCVTRE